MNISIYGAGYVGLVTAACLAKLDHKVFCVDINPQKITALQNGLCPIHEEQLPELLREQTQNQNLKFSCDLQEAVNFSSIHFIAAGTPSMPDGSADLAQVYSVVDSIITYTQVNCIIVTKSTVPVGTGSDLEAFAQEKLINLQKKYSVQVVSNPEFLREGCAVKDFLYADRVVLGGDTEALQSLVKIYEPLAQQDVPIITMGRESAELTKYSANAFLANKVSFMNQISRIAEKVGADIEEIKAGISTDHRIGPYFLNAGIGYGGSCFPKDNRALIQTSKNLGINAPLLEGIEAVNIMQKYWVLEQLNNYFKQGLENKIIGLWGLAFKPGTDDLREASSLFIIDNLLAQGVAIAVFDPVALEQGKKHYAGCDTIVWCENPEQVISTSHALVIATEWDCFKEYPLVKLKQLLANKPLFDGRNCYSLQAVEEARLNYYCSVGRKVVQML
jgi:UDPglucose 6-dehydrogenase